jgi:tRNA (guanosine-2'-O-)-methyltransferase
MKTSDKIAAIEYLTTILTSERIKRIESVLAERTRYICLVLEDIFQPHNAAAVMRTCDCMGIQDVHIIENRNLFKPEKSSVAIGAEKWLNLYWWTNKPEKSSKKPVCIANQTVDCLKSLKKQGYKIIGTTLRENAIKLQDLSLNCPIAIIMGTEKTGMTEEAHALADEYMYVPMAGFSQSLNVSVTTGIVLHEVTQRLKSSQLNWKLSTQDYQNLKLEWMINSTSFKSIEDVLNVIRKAD